MREKASHIELGCPSIAATRASAIRIRHAITRALIIAFAQRFGAYTSGAAGSLYASALLRAERHESIETILPADRER